MNPWKEHIAQLDELLKALKDQLLPYWKPAHKKEKLAQLKSVEKSINQLQKGNTPIPDELRDLKFRLLNKLELFKQAETARAEIQRVIQPLIAKTDRLKRSVKKGPEQPNKKKEKKEPRITLQNLVENGLIERGTRLSKTYKGIQHNAVITHDGSIKMKLDGKETSFISPSAAAVAASGKAQNGWTWWGIDGQLKGKNLDHYRQKAKDTSIAIKTFIED